MMMINTLMVINGVLILLRIEDEKAAEGVCSWWCVCVLTLTWQN